MSKFRKKPIVIEAVKVTKMMIEAISAERTPEIPELIIRANREVNSMWTTDPHLIIKTLEGDMRANIGDWIIEGVSGEVYPCKPDIFNQTYESVF
jgi:hypothetical protein